MICPACVAASIAARLAAMTEAEKRQAAREAILAAPTEAVNKIAERVGLPRPFVMAEKRKLVREGLCEWDTPAKLKPSEPQTRRKGQGAGGASAAWKEVAAAKRTDREDAALEIVRKLGPVTAEEVGIRLPDAAKLARPKRSTERLLHALADQGKVVQTAAKRKDGRGIKGSPAVWTAKP